MMNVNPKNAALCPFPDTAWSTRFRGQSGLETPLLPPGWRSTVSLPDPQEFVDRDECAVLVELKNDYRDQARKREITSQAASDVDAVVPVELAVTGSWLGQECRKLVRAVLDNTRPPIFHFKEQFLRGRPGHCCKADIDPMFPTGDLYPGHPSYPSGHATQAYSVALVFAFIRPDRRDLLLKAAERVADNREIAGLHYKSDSRAGARLAESLVALLLKNGQFQQLVDAARPEVGSPAASPSADAPAGPRPATP